MAEPQLSAVMSRRALLLGAAGAGALVVVPRVALADANVDALLGGWSFAGGQAERDALAKAITDAVAPISVLVRKVARERLEQANPIPAKLTLAADKLSFMLAYDAELFAAPLDGKAVKVKTSAGEELSLRVHVAGAAVDQTFSGEDKSRKNHLVVKDDELAIDVIVKAAELPKPMTYRLTYKRTA